MTKEGYVKKAVEDLLKAERIRYWRMNTGDRLVCQPHTGVRYRIRGHAKGTPDLLAAVPLPKFMTLSDQYGNLSPGPETTAAMFCWIECKAPGKSPTDEQLQFADEARNNGEFWLCVDDVRQLAEWLKENRAR